MTLTFTRPDDWHLHVRDGAALRTVVPHSARCFQRAIIMPNLRPPVTSTEQALAYRRRILAAVPKGGRFEPLMTLYLTDELPPAEIRRAKASGHTVAVKLYPAGATTNAESGVTAIEKTYATLEAMEEAGMPLLVHGEVTHPGIDIFDREKVFVEQVLAPLVRRFAGLPIVLEHATTREAIDFVRSAPKRVAATITAHHLLFNRNQMLVGGIRPHFFCLPILKREPHRRALIEAATSGSPKFFLGTDSAPHPRHAKESACGCAGCYTAHAAIELYAEAFEQAKALDRLEGFASLYGPDFYGLPRNTETITLVKDPWIVDQEYPLGEQTVIPLRAGEAVSWRLTEERIGEAG